jgi:hypothetical protein
MDVPETTRLCRLIEGIVPAQKFTEDTPVFWAGVLRDVRYADALEAVRRVPRRDGFIDPADIVDEVRSIRQQRLEAAGFDALTPNVDPELAGAYAAELRALRTAIADGALNDDDVEKYRAGVFTVTGAPVRPMLTAEEVSKPGVLEAASRSLFRRPPPPAPDEAHNADHRDTPPKTVGREQAEAMERERSRQLAALELMMGSET